MRVVLLGSTAVSRSCLATLLRLDVEVAGVLTTPSEITISYSRAPIAVVCHADMRTEAAHIGIPAVVVTGKIQDWLETIADLKPDLLLAAGWYYMIPHEIRLLAGLGCVGVHASLLPRYRGGAPINWAIINGEERTGVSLFHLEDEVDSGDIVGQAEIGITPKDTCATLYERVILNTQSLLETYLPMIARGCAPRIPQDKRFATVFPQRRPEDGGIAWAQPTGRIYNWVRALTRPYPGAFTFLNGIKLFVWRARPLEGRADAPPGTVVSVSPGRSIVVATADGLLRCIELEGCPWERVRPGVTLWSHGSCAE